MALTRKPYKVLRHKRIYAGRAVNLSVDRVRLPDGNVIDREIILHGGSAVMIPVAGRGRLILIRQFRYCAGGYIWEFPAGTIDRGETPLACAKRELIEEIGYSAARWRKLRTFYPTPGVSTEVMHLFLATELEKSVANPEFDELISARTFRLKEIERMIRNGKINDGKTILAFYELRQSGFLNRANGF
ncbi:MAG TPA: NUDIX hydrolase [Candidatus Omnitrophota bacterium]|nr:NUDIX hydrolase [Candidatus Omnitrophota bacterium]